jgi:hypothetical protein
MPYNEKNSAIDVPSREGLIERVYSCIESGKSLDSVHIPHSDVFYVREALEDRFTGQTFTLEQVEEYMESAGWKDTNRHGKRSS